MGSILYIIGAVLVALWLIGFLMHLGGGLIHIILVIAVIVFLYQFLTGRRSV
jgi:4-hydroxybenzoate polyprenyltransferase